MLKCLILSRLAFLGIFSTVVQKFKDNIFIYLDTLPTTQSSLRQTPQTCFSRCCRAEELTVEGLLWSYSNIDGRSTLLQGRPYTLSKHFYLYFFQKRCLQEKYAKLPCWDWKKIMEKVLRSFIETSNIQNYANEAPLNSIIFQKDDKFLCQIKRGNKTYHNIPNGLQPFVSSF